MSYSTFLSGFHRMTPAAATRAGRTSAAFACVLVAVILLIPSLVYATTHLRHRDDTSSSLRLRRGFDVPQTKWTLSPPAAGTFDRTTTDVSVRPRAWQQDAIADALLAPQHHRSPDPLRGPPLS